MIVGLVVLDFSSGLKLTIGGASAHNSRHNLRVGQFEGG